MPHSSRSSYRFERLAATLSLCVSVVLLAIKFWAYALTGSSAIFSDALESIVNVLASAFALYSIVLAHSPPDERHPYGHGKVEFLSAGIEGGMILLAACVIVWHAIEKFIYDAPMQRIDLGIVMMAGAMLVNGAVGFFLIRGGRTHGSITLEADGKHLFADAVTSAVVSGALLLVHYTGWKWLDPVAAILVAIYMLLLAKQLLARSAAGLMDEQDLEDDRLLRQILDSHLPASGVEPLICSYHKLRHRHTGRYHWVDFHILVPSEWSIERGHETASTIEYEIERALKEGNATAHVEPCNTADCPTCTTR